jgi:hypothetical protein
MIPNHIIRKVYLVFRETESAKPKIDPTKKYPKNSSQKEVANFSKKILNLKEIHNILNSKWINLRILNKLIIMKMKNHSSQTSQTRGLFKGRNNLRILNKLIIMKMKNHSSQTSQTSQTRGLFK